MLVFYVDEIGVGEMNAPSLQAHPWFILGALGIRDVNRQSIAAAIRELKDRAFGSGWQSRPWNHTEIKGRCIATAKRRLDSGRIALEPTGYRALTRDTLEELIDGIFKTFRTFSPTLYAIGIDKQRHVSAPRTGAPFDPIAIAYAFLQQRLAALVEHTSDSSEGALIIADEQSHHESLFRKGEVRAVRIRFQQSWIGVPNISAIIAKPVWIDTAEMVLDREISQLTDFMLYVVYLGMAHRLWNHDWLERLGPHFARHWGRGRRIGAVWNAGITIYPRPLGTGVASK